MPNVDITLAFFFRQLRFLDVSFNKIRGLEGNGLSKACPLLERFYFTHNLVDDLREILALGKLKNLYELEFRNNPVVCSDERIREVRERVQRDQAQLTDKNKMKFPKLILINGEDIEVPMNDEEYLIKLKAS